jgi:hypothetical protein
MLLRDCDLIVNAAVSAPLVRREPEEAWVRSAARGMPLAVFDFYEQAGYFSLDRAPRFLNDPNHVLFSFLGVVAEGLRGSITEAISFQRSLVRTERQSYAPFSGADGEKYGRRRTRSLRYLAINLTASLDAFAEMVALHFPEEIVIRESGRRLLVGQAQFQTLLQVLKAPDLANCLVRSRGQIVSPRSAELDRFHQDVRPSVSGGGGPSDGWLDFLFLLRNKLAHLGTRSIDYVGFRGPNGRMYTFMPREWPFMIPTMVRRGRPDQTLRRVDQDTLESLVQQDVVSMTAGFLRNTKRLIAVGMTALARAYRTFADFEPNATSLTNLAPRRFAFRNFSPARSGGAVAGPSGSETG